jgi:hypothetical protein
MKYGYAVHFASAWGSKFQYDHFRHPSNIKAIVCTVRNGPMLVLLGIGI